MQPMLHVNSRLKVTFKVQQFILVQQYSSGLQVFGFQRYLLSEGKVIFLFLLPFSSTMSGEHGVGKGYAPSLEFVHKRPLLELVSKGWALEVNVGARVCVDGGGSGLPW